MNKGKNYKGRQAKENEMKKGETEGGTLKEMISGGRKTPHNYANNSTVWGII